MKRAPTEDELFRRWQFGLAAYLASSPISLDYDTAVEMTKGTQEVPRDFLISCMYGRGYEIVGPDGQTWQVADHSRPTVEQPVQSEEVPWSIKKTWQQSVDGTVAQVDYTLDPADQEMLIIWDEVSSSSSAFRTAIVSTDNGATYRSALGDYRAWQSNGVPANQNAFYALLTQSTAILSAIQWIVGLQLGNRLCVSIGMTAAATNYQFIQSNNPITNIRLRNTAGNLNGGKITILTR